MMRGFPAFVVRAVRAQYTSIPPREVFVPQFVDAGYGSLMLLTILTFFAGLNLAVQSFGPFSRIGAQDMLGMFAGIGGVRELFPVMAAVVGGAECKFLAERRRCVELTHRPRTSRIGRDGRLRAQVHADRDGGPGGDDTELYAVNGADGLVRGAFVAFELDLTRKESVLRVELTRTQLRIGLSINSDCRARFVRVRVDPEMREENEAACANALECEASCKGTQAPDPA